MSLWSPRTDEYGEPMPPYVFIGDSPVLTASSRLLDVQTDWQMASEHYSEIYAQYRSEMALYGDAGPGQGTMKRPTPDQFPPAPCSGSGGPSINGMPDNVDQWGTCPVCGGTSTSSARIMAQHVESTSPADKANLADLQGARWMIVDRNRRAVTSSYGDRAEAADAKAKSFTRGPGAPYRIVRDVVAESAIAAGITDPNA